MKRILLLIPLITSCAMTGTEKISTAWMITAITADAYTTHKGLSHGAIETNPIYLTDHPTPEALAIASAIKIAVILIAGYKWPKYRNTINALAGTTHTIAVINNMQYVP